MRSTTTIVGRRAVDSAGCQRRHSLATLLLVCLVCGCGGRTMSRGIAPRLAPASDSLAIRTTMAPVTTSRIRVVSASSPKTVLRWRHSYEGATTPLPPMLMLVDGVALGLRPDSTVDHAAAKLLLQRIRCRDVVSINVVKGEQALRQFGRAADPGAILIVTASHTWRAAAGFP